MPASWRKVCLVAQDRRRLDVEAQPHAACIGERDQPRQPLRREIGEVRRIDDQFHDVAIRAGQEKKIVDQSAEPASPDLDVLGRSFDRRGVVVLPA